MPSQLAITYAPFATPSADAYFVRSNVGSACRLSANATGLSCCFIATRQPSATSLASAGRITIIPGIARNAISCSIG